MPLTLSSNTSSVNYFFRLSRLRPVILNGDRDWLRYSDGRIFVKRSFLKDFKWFVNCYSKVTLLVFVLIGACFKVVGI